MKKIGAIFTYQLKILNRFVTPLHQRAAVASLNKSQILLNINASEF